MGKRRYANKNYDLMQPLLPSNVGLMIESEPRPRERPSYGRPARVESALDPTSCRVCHEPTMIPGVDRHIMCILYGG